MLEQPESGDRKEESGKFITERIVGRRDRRKRILRFIIKCLLAGALFAAAAVCTLILSRPLYEKYFVPQTSAAAEPIQIGRDEPAESTAAGMTEPTTAPSEPTAAPAEPESSDGTEESGSAGQTAESAPEEPGSETPGGGSETAGTSEENADSETGKSAEEFVAEAMETYPYSTDDIRRLSDSLRREARDMEQSIAVVTRVQEQQDWFENALSESGIYAGAAVAKTDTELLVLTTVSAAEDADLITVSFGDESPMKAEVKRLDPLSGLAVLTVAVTDENRSLIEKIEPVPLGSSAQMAKGNIVLLLGAPYGYVYTEDYGIIARIWKNVSVTDGEATILTTSAHGSAVSGTWAFNLDGSLIGWVTDLAESDSENIGNASQIYGVSEFKAILERMLNGQSSPYLGIHGIAVTPDVEQQGVPAGIYVTDTDRDSPSYREGIQPGDIITEISGETIADMRDYTEQLEKLHAEDLVKIKVMRNGREEYAPLEFNVTVGAR